MDLHQDFLYKAEAYQPTAEALDPIRHVPLLFAVGISGAGKDTILKRLIAEHPELYQFMVSYTTRRPRENRGIPEKDGVDYHFIDVATAERMLDQGEFVEVNYYADNMYGTSIAEIAKAKDTHKTIIKDVDVHGVGNYVRMGMNIKPVFLLPPNYEIWRDRLVARYGGKIDQSDLHKRMTTALDELTYALEKDFFYLVINDKLEQTVDTIMRITKGDHAEQRPRQAIEDAKNIADAIRFALKAIDISTQS